MLKTSTIKIIKEPRITAKMLCEYNEASALARMSILKRSKIMSPAVLAISKRYSDAKDFICTGMQHSFDFLEILVDYAKDLRAKAKKFGGKDAENMILCAEALEKFYKMDKVLHRKLNALVLRDASSAKGKSLNINGTTVSIRPEIMIYDQLGEAIGFIKLCFSKSEILKPSIAMGTASLGRLYFAEKELLSLNPENCIVIDIFANQIHTTPKNTKRILDQLRACCAEIADRWDKI